MNPTRSQNSRLRGVAVSAGLAIGRAHRVEQEMPDVPEYCITPEHMADERQRFLDALTTCRQELATIRERLARELESPEPLHLIDAHALMLDDPTLRDGVLAHMAEHCNAEWAVKRYLTDILQVFQEMEDSYLREKQRDIEQMGRRLLHALLGNRQVFVPLLPEPVILVAEEFTPSDALLMRRENVLGFVAELGGPVSHTAILARSMGIPAIVGVSGAMAAIREGDRVAVDGIGGWVHINPESIKEEQFLERQQRFRQFRLELLTERSGPALSRDGERLRLLANIEMSRDTERAMRLGAEGVGLYRTEHLFMNRSDLPSEEEQVQHYRQALETMKGLPVTFRTLDVGGEKQADVFHLRSRYRPINPALGLHAIRLCLGRERAAFLTQLRAILQAGVHGQPRIMFPLISRLEELREAKAVLEEARQGLQRQGRPFATEVPVGMMVEVPAAALCADRFAREVDFFSIGTNDLIQFTLAVDRVDETVASLYTPLHPAVLRLIRSTIELAGEKPVSLCGEMAREPRLVALLMGLGLRELSLNAICLPLIRRTIRGITIPQARQVATAVLAMDDPREASRYLDGVLEETFGKDHLFH